MQVDAGNTGSVPGLGRSPGGGHGSLLQYSCLENFMGRRDWQATVHRVTKSRTRLKWLSMHTHTYYTRMFCICVHTCMYVQYTCVCILCRTYMCMYIMSFPGGSVTKNPPAKQETKVPSLGTKEAFLPGTSHGQRNLAGYSPWDCKKSDTA